MRDQVDKANIARLAGIQGKAVIFHAQDIGVNDEADRKKIKDACMAPDTLELKIGAQVLNIKSILLIKGHDD